MKGLILKDLYTLGNYKKTLLITLGVAIVFSIAMGNTGGTVATVMVLLSGTVALSTFSYDETAKWDRYAITLPVGRGAIVNARYLACLAVLGGFFLAVLAIQLVGGALRSGAEYDITGLSLLWVTFCIALISLSVSLPMAFWLGAEKARMLSIVGYLVPGGILLLVVYLLGGRIEALPDSAFLAIGAGLLLFSLALFGASWLVARRLYARREF